MSISEVAAGSDSLIDEASNLGVFPLNESGLF